MVAAGALAPALPLDKLWGPERVHGMPGMGILNADAPEESTRHVQTESSGTFRLTTLTDARGRPVVRSLEMPKRGVTVGFAGTPETLHVETLKLVERLDEEIDALAAEPRDGGTIAVHEDGTITHTPSEKPYIGADVKALRTQIGLLVAAVPEFNGLDPEAIGTITTYRVCTVHSNSAFQPIPRHSCTRVPGPLHTQQNWSHGRRRKSARSARSP